MDGDVVTEFIHLLIYFKSTVITFLTSSFIERQSDTLITDNIDFLPLGDVDHFGQ